MDKVTGHRKWGRAVLPVLALLLVLVVGLLGSPMASHADGSNETATWLSEQLCVEEVPGATTNLNCTANDVRIASVQVLDILDDGCAYPGDTVTFSAKYTLILNATSRYDIGLWFAEQGDAYTGVCTVAMLATAPPPWTDIDGDMCGDVSSATALYPIVTITATCTDTDLDGNLNVPSVTSWRVNSNELCNNPLQTYPTEKSKCRGEQALSVPIDVPPPGVYITKYTNDVNSTAAPGVQLAVGDSVTWKYVVSNSGEDKLYDVVVSDSEGVTVTCPPLTEVGNLDAYLDPDEILTCYAYGTAMAGQYSNIGRVDAMGFYSEEPVWDEEPDFYFGVGPGIDIEKATNGVDADAPTGPVIPVGGAVTWSYVVTNTGNVDLSNIVVADSMGVTPVYVSGDTNADDILQVGETWVYEASGVAAAGQYANTGTVTGTPSVGEPVTDSDHSHYYGAALTATKTAVGSYDREVTWTLDKTVYPLSHTGYAGAEAGSSTWTVVATKSETQGNYLVTGEITISNPTPIEVEFSVADTLDDDTAATVVCPVTNDNTGTVPAGGSVICTYTASPADASATLNTAVITPVNEDVAGATAEAGVTFTGTLIGYDEGTLSDDRFSYSELISASATETFPETFYCPSDPSLYVDGTYTFTETNTAVLNGNINLSDSAEVTVTCTLQPLTVTKDAAGTYDRTVTWALSKSVTPDSHTGVAGDTFDSTWTVTATKSATLGNYQVTGTITVTNPAAIAQDFTISDALSDGTLATVVCPVTTDNTGTVPAAVGGVPGSVTCTYTASPSDALAASNTVTVTAAGNAAQADTKPVLFTENLIGYDSGTLSDPRFAGDPWVYVPESISATTPRTFDETFACSTNIADYAAGGSYSYTETNIAYLNDNIDLQASATVDVTCTLPMLQVEKTATGTFDHTVTWALTKSVTPDSHTGAAGETAGASIWTVTATKSEALDNYQVTGTITITNPSAVAQPFTISDVLDDGTVATVDCPFDIVPANDSVTCTYTAMPADDSATLNTVTVSADGYADVIATAPVSFTENLIGYDSGTLSDPRFEGAPWDYVAETIDTTTTRTFEETFGCPSDVSLYTNGVYSFTETNTAYLNDSIDLEASASVDVTCTLQPLTVAKDAAGTYDRTVTWELSKSVDPASHTGFIGADAGTSIWTVTATKSELSDNYQVTGTITITNPAAVARPFTISDVLSDRTVAAVDCLSDIVPANDSVTCTYTATPAGGSATLNTATLSAAGNADVIATAAVSFTENLKGFDSVTVDDDRDTEAQFPATISETTTFDYDETFTCSSTVADYIDLVDSDSYPNTATIAETGQSAEATVDVTCYIPTIAKTAAGTYDERHEWTIDKSVTPASQSGFIGDTLSYEWEVVVTEDTYEENFDVAGSITITNPNPYDAMTVVLSDVLGDGTAADISACTGDADLTDGLTVAAGGSSVCDYTASDLSLTSIGDAPVLNTATLTLNDIAFDAEATIEWTPNVIRGSAVLNDDQNPDPNWPLTITEGGTWTYTEDYTCSTDTSLYAGDNTYTFSEDNLAVLSEGDTIIDDDAATANIDCYVPAVSKTADGTYTKTHTWDIDKTVNPVSQSGIPAQELRWTWTVDVSETSADSDFAVTGTITVVNPNAEDALIVALSDALSDTTVASISGCTGGDFAAGTLTVPAGGTAVCDYSAAPTGLATNNVATATLNNIPFIGQATINWTPTVLNGAALVTDTEIGLSETLLAGQGPWTFTGTDSHTCATEGSTLYTATGYYGDTIDNTATVLGSDGQTDSDSATTEYLCSIEAMPAIDIEKATNGEDTDLPTGPYIPVGGAVTWTYVVTNTGNVDLTNVNVVDDNGTPLLPADDFTVTGPVNCVYDEVVVPPAVLPPFDGTLAAGSSMTCTATGIAVMGQYANLGTVTAMFPETEETVTDSDPSHYFGSAPAIDIEKATNGQDADDPTGPYIPVGGMVTWRYVATNTGNVDLTNVSVSDDLLGVICAFGTLKPGESFTCDELGTAVAGQYANVGTVRGTPPVGAAVTDTDPSHYYGLDAAIDIEKATNGEDADTAPGPYIPVGGSVTWTYVVTNTGNVDLTDIQVTDDHGVTVICPATELAAGASMTCTADGTAALGQYANIGSVTGTTPAQTTVTDSDPSHYYGSAPAIVIEKATNGVDADTLTGPYIPVGNPVAWTYVVTNTGNVALSDVSVTDDQGVTVTCPKTALVVGESVICTAYGTAVAGQYANVGTVTGTPPVGANVTDEDPSHYYGSAPAIQIEKATNGEDADTPTGPYIPVGGAVTWTYVVTNTGNVDLTDIEVTDNQGVIPAYVSGDDGDGVLQTTETWVYETSGTAAAGQYANTGTVTGTPPAGADVSDTDPSHYYGSAPAIDIEKATNGEDADTATGPYIAVGGAVTWTYVVTNTGNVDLMNVAVVDDNGTPADDTDDYTCEIGDLAVGAIDSTTCSQTGTAVEGQYGNIGYVEGWSPIVEPVSDSDPSHYFGAAPAIDIEKATNGEDADLPTGPKVPVGDPVTWSYVVENTGNVDLTGVALVDDNGTPADTTDDYTCTIGDLAVGAVDTATCQQVGVAEEGQYGNIAVATGYFETNVGPVATSQSLVANAVMSVTDSDPSHYLGVVGALQVTKTVQLLQDAATIVDPDMTFEICAIGPSFAQADCVLLKDGESHTWTGLIPGEYIVTETAPVHALLTWAVEVVYEAAAESATVVAEGTAEVTVLNIADYKSPPTAVDLKKWDVMAGQSGVMHTWQTVAEKNVSGFRVYRGSSSAFGEAQMVGEIAAKGPSVYQWVEPGVAAGTWSYWLVEVDGSGAEIERFGPKVATVGVDGQTGGFRTYLPLTTTGR